MGGVPKAMGPVPKTKRGQNDSLPVRYAISCLAASMAETVTYPLDLAKTRLQIQGEVGLGGSASSAARHLGALGTGASILREEGPRGLYRGLSPAIGRHVLYTGIRICAYEKLRKLATDEGSVPITTGRAMACGATAGAFAQLFASPADLIKVQLQMEGRRRAQGLPPRVHGVLHATQKIVSEGGLAGLWKGWLPSIQRAALVNMADLATYDKVKRILLRETGLGDTWLLHGLSSIFAGLAAAICSTPMDVVKTRVMNQSTDSAGRGLLYKGTLDCFAKTVRQEGFLALYKGFVPIWTRMGPWSLTFWVSYEEIRKLAGSSSF